MCVPFAGAAYVGRDMRSISILCFGFIRLIEFIGFIGFHEENFINPTNLTNPINP
jgi:hypothetical protein